MMNAANYSKSSGASTLRALLCLVVFAVSLPLSAQNLSGSQNISLQQIRVQDFNGGLGNQSEQTQSLGTEAGSITDFQNGSFTTNLNTNFGNLDLVFQREVNNAWSAKQFPGCPQDVDIVVTFANGEMVSTLNGSDTSGVTVESIDVSKKYKKGCLDSASGSLRFYIDITHASAAGTYSGNMTIEVNPVY